MATIKLPSYLKEGHGRMDDAVIMKWKGITFMKPYKKPDDRVLSPGQIASRRNFTDLVSEWKLFPGIVRASWNAHVKDLDMTGYNLYLGSNIAHRRAGEPLQISLSFGEEGLQNFTAIPGGPGEVRLSFLPVAAERHLTIFCRRLAVPDDPGEVTRHDMGAQPVSPVVISGLHAGANYHVYAVVTDRAYNDATTVSGSAGAAVTAGA